MRKYELEGIVYDSRSEAAVSALLTRYIPSWKAVEGRTLHVSDGITSVDFVVGNILIEWHPISRYESLLSYKQRKMRLISKSPTFSNKNMIIASKLSEVYTSILVLLCNPNPKYSEVENSFQFFIHRTKLSPRRIK